LKNDLAYDDQPVIAEANNDPLNVVEKKSNYGHIDNNPAIEQQLELKNLKD